MTRKKRRRRRGYDIPEACRRKCFREKKVFLTALNDAD